MSVAGKVGAVQDVGIGVADFGGDRCRFARWQHFAECGKQFFAVCRGTAYAAGFNQ